MDRILPWQTSRGVGSDSWGYNFLSFLAEREREDRLRADGGADGDVTGTETESGAAASYRLRPELAEWTIY